MFILEDFVVDSYDINFGFCNKSIIMKFSHTKTVVLPWYRAAKKKLIFLIS